MDNARKPSKQQLIRRSARIREHAADPTAHGTPAWKVDQLLHDGDLSAMSVLDVIDYETRRLKDADGFVDPSDMAGVCRHLSREKVLHVALGVPVLQVRAASRYLALLAREHPVAPTFEERCDIWDRAVTEYMDRKWERVARHEIKDRIKFLPMSDGMSSAPVAPRRMSGCGLKAWEDLYRSTAPKFVGAPPADDERGDWEYWEDQAARSRPVEAAPAFDAAFLAEHGIDRSMVERLGAADRERIRPLVERTEPLHGGAVRLDWVVGNETLTRALVRRWPELRPDALLTRLGMPNRISRTALVFEQLRRISRPPIDELALWNQAVAHQAGLKHPRAARWGRDGLNEYRHQQALLRRRLVAVLQREGRREAALARA